MTTSRLIRYGLLVVIGMGLSVAPVLASASFLNIVFEAVSFVVYVTLGGLIIARREGHITGWLLTLIGLFLVFIASVTQVARAQLTWVVFGLVMLVTAIVLTFIFIGLSVALGVGDPGDDAWTPAYLVIVSFPLTFGEAILRYRLYEIDRIISRTISYVAVVGLLAGVFMAVVTAVGSTVQTDSNLAIAASTLAVAALFNPLRKRVQSVVDRRFNRSRYDAERVAESFAGSLQGRIDSQDLVADWINVVSETMQPSLVGVWVRD